LASAASRLQATNRKGTRFKMMLPGVQFSTTPQDYAPMNRLAWKFEGSSWKLIDEAAGTSASAK
jgi:hypothetical protein